MPDTTNRYTDSVLASGSLRAKNADVDGWKVGTFKTDAFSVQPMTARFASK